MDPIIDDHGRIEPPVDGDEWITLSAFLDYQRATFAWKVADLDLAQLGQPLPSSSMTLAGMMKHLAFVEDDWFGTQLMGVKPRDPWASVDWASTPDWEWDSAIGHHPDELRRLWEDAVARGRSAAASAYQTGGLSQAAATPWADGRTPTLRWIITHMIEEYARHNGHADLLREAVDGQTGE